MKPSVGSLFGSLTLLALPGEGDGKKALFRCVCGNEKRIRLDHVTTGATVSCGCAKRSVFVAIGQKSGRLTVIDPEAGTRGKARAALCQCECGRKKLVDVWQIANQVTRSCGCLVVDVASELSLRHGEEGTRLYVIWNGMKRRCHTPSAGNWHRYGGRGISVCKEWIDSYEAFRDWAISAGYADNLQIDRINNDGNYGPENCRWVTSSVNANNRGNHHRLAAFGETKTLAEWARDPRCRISISALKQRARKSLLSSEEILTLNSVQARSRGNELRRELGNAVPESWR